MAEETFVYLADVLRVYLKAKDSAGHDIKNGHVMTVLNSLAEAEAKLAAVREVHARYFDTDLEPGEAYSTPEPEDVWRFDRDFRAAVGSE